MIGKRVVPGETVLPGHHFLPLRTHPAAPRTLAPPKSPTDPQPADWVVGRITRGGTGPCYGLVTDDEQRFALHSTAGTVLREGDLVRVQFARITPKIDCGPGFNVGIVKVQPVG
ncbi:hypothetical protein AB0B31_37575 [Catellatospora citrea]|uniref:hypothetical protein n=1 Tax=Catellatospora citrea TaxID=53366 RepID=UPI0033CAA116